MTFVASPKANGRIPDAKGSSVPAWPNFFCLKRRLIIPPALVDVMPSGLSKMIQPCVIKYVLFWIHYKGWMITKALGPSSMSVRQFPHKKQGAGEHPQQEAFPSPWTY